MRQYKEEIKPEERIKIHTKTICDLCGKEALHGNWDNSVYQISDTEITITLKQEDGTSYPEGGNTTKYQVDMCPNCFKDKLIPWLDSQGCKGTRLNWDW